MELGFPHVMLIATAASGWWNIPSTVAAVTGIINTRNTDTMRWKQSPSCTRFTSLWSQGPPPKVPGRDRPRRGGWSGNDDVLRDTIKGR